MCALGLDTRAHWCYLSRQTKGFCAEEKGKDRVDVDSDGSLRLDSFSAVQLSISIDYTPYIKLLFIRSNLNDNNSDTPSRKINNHASLLSDLNLERSSDIDEHLLSWDV